jgi:hypothetical protein
MLAEILKVTDCALQPAEALEVPDLEDRDEPHQQ